MLSKEEKKSIEKLNELLNYCKKEKLANYENIIRTVLNLIEKLQKENQELKQENKRIKYFSNNLFIDDYIPKKVIKDKIKENKAKTYCKNCDNTCDSYQLCKFLEELLGDE